jgi:hypothetical protein
MHTGDYVLRACVIIHSSSSCIMSHSNIVQISTLVDLRRQICQPTKYHLLIIHWLASSFFLKQSLWFILHNLWFTNHIELWSLVMWLIKLRCPINNMDTSRKLSSVKLSRSEMLKATSHWVRIPWPNNVWWQFCHCFQYYHTELFGCEKFHGPSTVQITQWPKVLPRGNCACIILLFTAVASTFIFVWKHNH